MKIVISLFVVLLLTSCATTYQKEGWRGGFSETQLSENIFKVNFKGNGRTGSDRVGDFGLLRAAELTLEYGFNYFMVIDKTDETRVGFANNTLYHKPRAEILIKCFKEKPETNAVVYEAKFIIKSIKTKYDIGN